MTGDASLASLPTSFNDPSARRRKSARQYHYKHDSLVRTPRVARHTRHSRGEAIHASIGPTRDHGDTASHAPIAPVTQRQTPGHADMPHADHALAHAAPAFPGAGSCLERAQHHSAMPLAPRQVSELCTFRRTPTHWRRQAFNARESASGPHLAQAVHACAASPLDGLAQHVPCPPRHPEAGLTLMLHGMRHQGAGAGRGFC